MRQPSPEGHRQLVNPPATRRRKTDAVIVLTMASFLGACSNFQHTVSGDRRPSLRVADAALASGAPELALRVADMILENQPKNAPALVARGDALYALGRQASAKASYEQALAADPKSVAAQVGIGRVLSKSDPKAAEAAFLTALVADPDNVVALNDLGVVRDLQGHAAEAQSAYEHALSVAPDSPDTRINLGMSLAASGHDREAVSMLRDVAADPSVKQSYRDQLLAGLTLAGDGAWAMTALAPSPAGFNPYVAQDDNVKVAGGPSPLQDVATVAAMASADNPVAPRAWTEAVTATAVVASQLPVVEAAPLQPVKQPKPAVAFAPQAAPVAAAPRAPVSVVATAAPVAPVVAPARSVVAKTPAAPPQIAASPVAQPQIALQSLSWSNLPAPPTHSTIGRLDALDPVDGDPEAGPFLGVSERRPDPHA
jgi:Flp pilus assembly protein TadD